MFLFSFKVPAGIFVPSLAIGSIAGRILAILVRKALM